MWTHIAMELEYPVLHHLAGPNTWGENEHMACASFLGIDTELLRLPGGLRARASNYQDILEAILVESVSGEANGSLALFMGEMLGFAIATLHQYTLDATLLQT